MISVPTYPNFNLLYWIVGGIVGLVLLSGLALVGTVAWRRSADSRRHQALGILRFALIAASIHFVVTGSFVVMSFYQRFFRTPLDVASGLFWPAASGVIAFVACRQLKQTTDGETSSNDRNA